MNDKTNDWERRKDAIKQQDGEIIEYDHKNGPRVVRLETTKSDSDLAIEYKERIKEAYQPLIDVLNEIDKDGFQCIAGVGKDAFGRYTIVQLDLIKKF